MHILVTGGSRGIGAAVCRLAGAEGWSVSLSYQANAQAAADTVSATEEAGGRAIALQGDVADEADVARNVREAVDALGPLTGVVINAGVVTPGCPVAQMDGARIRRIFEINVLGAFYTAREAARQLSTDYGGQGGAIVVVSSAAARLGSPGEYVDYAASKGALDTMTIGLAKELAPGGVRVNAVRPGLIETEIHASGGAPDRAARLGAATPIGRAGTAEEVAESIIWLLSDRASYVTGALLDVAGGR